ncbi:hypothetical protein [Vagococcus sp.]|uniref:hypothetical protein n=1 Tax=Vagococcus sp. TaxID=1933889 RepID=UPI002FC8CD56
MPIKQKRTSSGCSMIFLAVVLVICLFLFVTCSVPRKEKIQQEDTIRDLTREVFSLRDNDVRLSFSQFYVTEAGHYEVQITLNDAYKTNKFLNENFHQNKEPFFAPSMTKQVKEIDYGKNYSDDSIYTSAMGKYMQFFGFEETHDITVLEHDKFQAHFLTNEFNKEEIDLNLKVISPDGWKNYLNDFYPYDYQFSTSLKKLNKAKGYFLVIRDKDILSDITDGKERMIQTLSTKYRLENIPNNTLFIVDTSDGMTYLVYQDKKFQEIYQ